MPGGESLHQAPEDGPYAVVGGGLAGLAAAEALAGAGKRVVLLEQRAELGGRISSFRDPGTGWYLDNGQHVWMPCCTELTDFLDRTGIGDLVHVQPRLRIMFLERGRREAVLEALNLPTPFHLLLPFLTFPPLRPGERAALLRGLLSLKRSGDQLLSEGEGMTFGEWLAGKRQPARVIECFWEPVITSILNQGVDEVRADLAAMALLTSFLAGKGDANLAWLSQPHGIVWDRVAGVLEERGVSVRRGSRVEGIELGEELAGEHAGEHAGGQAGARGGEPRAIALLLAGGERLPVAGVVTAIPPGGLRKLVPAGWRDASPFIDGDGLDWSPILNLHVWFDQPITTEPFLCVLNSPLQWIFVKAGQTPGGGRNPIPATAQHLDLLVSASDRFLGQGDRQTTGLLLEELEAVLPEARSAQLLATTLVHETRATFRAVPGSEAHRPSQQTPIQGLSIAGAWTATGWPATLEGAVRSGRAAVRALGVNTT